MKAGTREFVRFAYENPEVYRLMFGAGVRNLMKEPVYRAASEATMRKTSTELYGADIYNLEDIDRFVDRVLDSLL